ncbi:hypothetical protein GGX14DRAFT_582828 [Mycena pura]|uniref:Uncharacterized protein n=1 Tax=Mycena pura TaxID=153505 RepID=A0AAD6YVH2_9AGAR|nr:hypothetical protein GGX14DRAFT_582828 [Mycena pura]
MEGADVSLFVGLALALNPHPNAASSLKHRHVRSLLINPDAQPDLPTAEEAMATASAAGLNLSYIQCDVLIGMKKNTELFYFFSIANATDFKLKLASDILPLITTTMQLLDVNTQPATALNITFSQTGLTALGVTDPLSDSAFAAGQFVDLENLGDSGSANWVPQFVGTGIHGVFLFASDTEDNIDAAVASLEAALGDCVTKVYTLLGAAHFGFLDGISNPAVDGFTSNTTSRMPGQSVVAAGTVLLGESGDTVARPAWAKDGSFLVFRQLAQLVPEFNKFLMDNPVVEPGVLTAQQGSDLLGARMVGRWKSGAPVDLAPLFDDPALGADPMRNNDFTYSHPDTTLAMDQTRCPFSAHIRKTRPRADLVLPEGGEVHRIIRAGIPYGPEVSDDEATANTTSVERGLAFVAYQSNIGNGFRFLQQIWAGDAE